MSKLTESRSRPRGVLKTLVSHEPMVPGDWGYTSRVKLGWVDSERNPLRRCPAQITMGREMTVEIAVVDD